MNLVSVSQLRAKTAKVLDRVVSLNEPLTVMQRSTPKAVLVSHSYFTALEQSVLDLTDALEASKAKSEPTVDLNDYIKKRWPKSRNATANNKKGC